MILAISLAFAGDPAWKPVPDQPSYRFCTDPGVDAEEARAWCDLLAGLPPDACPGLRKTCAGETAGNTEDVDLWERMSGCGGTGSPEKTYTAPPPPPPAPSVGCDAPSMGDGWLALVQWTVALAIALGIVILARFVFLRFLGRRRDPAPPPPAFTRVRVTADAPAIPDRPSGDLLDEAELALAEGRLGDAVLMARAAALRKLGERGRITLAASRTDREYVRAAEPESRDLLRTIVRVVEEHRWARRPLDPADVRRALNAAISLVRGAVVAGLLLAAGTARAESRYGPEGDAALYEAYQRAGYDVSWRLRGLSTIEDDLDVLVLDLARTGLTDAEADSVRGWVERGGFLVVAGDASKILALGDLDVVDEPHDLSLGAVLAVTDLPAPALPDGPLFAWDQPTGTAWVELDDGRALVQGLALGQGFILSIADDRLIHNGALLSKGNEGFLVAAPYAGSDLTIFGTAVPEVPIPARLQLATHAGEEATNPVQSLWNARLLPVVLQILMVGALVALWRGVPFAPPRDPAADQRTAFTDHLRALGLRWQRLGASRRAVGQYARYGLERLGPDGLRQAALRHGMSPDEARSIVERAMKAAADLDGPDRPRDDLPLMETLWTLLRRT